MIWLIGLGGVAGTLSRFFLGKWISSKLTSGFPWGTWVINLTGSFILGVLFSLYGVPPTKRGFRTLRRRRSAKSPLFRTLRDAAQSQLCCVMPPL
jgi:fluoride ion exporter CrcB/FEX